MVKKVVKRYSQAFKQQVVNEYESGADIPHLQQKYGIGGGNTIQLWVKRYGREGLRHQLLVIQSSTEQDQVKQLKEQIAQLEKAVARLTVDKLMLESVIEVAEENGVPLLKKNGVRRSSTEPSKSKLSRGTASS